MTNHFLQACIYLCAAVIAVPLAKRFGLGSVLGYLIAGVIIGPVIGLVGQETESIQHFAEFGVVMMLFLVGLELEPHMLWNMRNRLLGLGGLQVGISVLVIALSALVFHQPWSVALAIGLILSLSSTAIVLQTFNEKGLNKTDGARSSFSVLLFQDIAVIPMLALIPLLALPELIDVAQQGLDKAGEHHEEIHFLTTLPAWVHAVLVIAAIASVVVLGHFLSRPLFRYVANSKLREMFTAASLMLVIGIAALMSLVGLSPALGTFLAGVVLANSEFRHELEINIEPFKGLLLGLFFITVGAGINFEVLFSNTLLIVGLTLAVMLAKALILYLLTFAFKVIRSDRWLFTLSLAQAGEFGFVLLSYSVQNHVISHELAQLLSLVVALSMFLTPGLFIFFDRVILPHYEASANAQEADNIDEQGTVIIAGVGRFGQIVNRLLVANGIKTVVLDHEANQVELLRQINVKSYFGDATRPDLLETAGIAEASMLVISLDDRVRSVELAKYAKDQYPHLKILARAFDRGHGYQLRSAGADTVISETYHSALELGGEALRDLGFHPYHTERQKSTFVEMEQQHNEELFEAWRVASEDNKFDTSYRELFMHLESVLHDAMNFYRTPDEAMKERGWTPPPKNYQDELD